MSHPNPDRDERVKEIRERLETVRYSPMFAKSAVVTMESYQAALRDVDTLLSLLDGQAAEVCLHCEKPIRRIGSAWLHVETRLVSCRRGKSQEHKGIYRAEPSTAESIANDAATRMRDRCVQELKSLIDAEQSKHPSAHVAVRRMALHDAITALQSLTLEGEQE